MGPAWKLSHFQNKMYAMPTRGSGGVYFYNKKMFDDAGVAYPKEGWTYDDLLAMAKKITVAGQKYGVGIAADLSDPSNVMSSFSPVLWAYGGDFLSADLTKCVLDSAEAVKAIKFWTELYTVQKVVPEGSIGYTISRDVVPLFGANKVAMLPFGVSGIDTFKKDPALQWDIVIPPSGKNRGGGWAYTIPVTAKHQKEAVDLLLWFAKPEIQAKLCATEPSNVNAWALAAPWNTPMYQTLLKAAKTGTALPPVGKWAEIQTTVIKELQKVLQGQETPEAAGKALVALIDPLLK
jgi:multiple sugar transport system substrate-binding protein